MNKLVLLVFFGLTISLAAQTKLPSFFANNMVLQRNTPIPVWGTAKANEKIEIRFNKQVKKTKADKNGKWLIRLDNEIAGGPYILTVKGNNTIEFKNVLVGEVWLCTGQSNMEWSVAQSNDFKKELASANNPMIRHIKIDKEVNTLPQNNVNSGKSWQVCDSITVGNFTAAGYFFAKNIYHELKIPIGLINASWGGTNIETWISREGFESSDEFKEMIAEMPKVSLDSLSKIAVEGFDKKIQALQGEKINPANASNYKETNYDDSKWPELNQPELWEQQSLGEFDGVVWLRKSIVLSAGESKKEAVLELSTIDDNDVAYINGVKVGSTSSWDAIRKYAIPSGILKEGINVIAIRVTDNGGGGGIYGNPDDLKLSLGATNIPLNGQWKFQVEAIKSSLSVNEFPSIAYNAMINPLIPYAFKGVLWYQGESNAVRSYQYRKAFPLLINDWRKKWNQGDFPFYYVQLASFQSKGNSNEGCGWAELREAQTMTLNLPNTGMVVTTDLVTNPRDIHPTNKQDVGKRLAAIALNNVYQKPMVCSGPMYKSMEIIGNQAVVSFNNIGSGLYTPDKYGYIKGFEIAGKDQVFHYAKASIKDNKVILSSEEVPNPVAVHFSWVGDATESNLFNKEGFPAVPFRTDEWKTVTKDEKYKFMFSISIAAQTKLPQLLGDNIDLQQNKEIADPNIILPPSWAFGVLYGGYTNQEETIETIKKIQEHDYPIDAYWIDSWFWSFKEKGKGPKKYLDFVADTISYPNRNEMWSFLEKNNIKGGFWVWDCILETGNEAAFKEFDSLGYFSKKYFETNTWHNNSSSTAMFQEGTNKKGTLCGNIDFENSEAVAFFKSKMKHFFDEGADFMKLDRTSKIETVKTIFEISQEFGRETEGRGFMLSHSFGTETEEYKRYPAKWTDDTRSDWTVDAPLKDFNSWVPNVAFKENIEMFTNPNKETSKIPFLTNDTGGFDMGITDQLDEELYIRWVQFSTFNPIMEVFSQPENKTGNLAFNYSEKAGKIFIKYSHLRMELFPYIYSYALATRIEGKNIIGPIDGYLYQFYFGEEFLVAPVYKKGADTLEIYFPKGNWVNFWTNKEITGDQKNIVDAPLEQIPLYVKKGAIIPMRPYASSIVIGSKDRIILHVFPGEDGNFKLLEDDGTSNDYLSGIYAETIIEMKALTKKSFKLKINKPSGNYKGMPNQRKWEIIIHSNLNYKKGSSENTKFDLIREDNNILKSKEIAIFTNEDFEIVFK